MRSVDDVIETFEKALRYKKNGWSKRRALLAIGKQLTSIKRVEHIHTLSVTKPEKFAEVRS